MRFADNFYIRVPFCSDYLRLTPFRIDDTTVRLDHKRVMKLDKSFIRYISTGLSRNLKEIIEENPVVKIDTKPFNEIIVLNIDYVSKSCANLIVDLPIINKSDSYPLSIPVRLYNKFDGLDKFEVHFEFNLTIDRNFDLVINDYISLLTNGLIESL